MSDVTAEQYADCMIRDFMGTCDSLPSEIQDRDDEEEIMRLIEDDMFRCDECGWWCCVSEKNECESGEVTCDDCTEEEN